MFSGIDKVLHLSIFAFLGFWFIARYPKMTFLYYIYILLIYSLITEILQDAMGWGRSGEILDLVADTLGLLIGYYLYKIVLKTDIFDRFL